MSLVRFQREPPIVQLITFFDEFFRIYNYVIINDKRDSSAVERSTFNRCVAGSNPAHGFPLMKNNYY